MEARDNQWKMWMKAGGYWLVLELASNSLLINHISMHLSRGFKLEWIGRNSKRTGKWKLKCYFSVFCWNSVSLPIEERKTREYKWGFVGWSGLCSLLPQNNKSRANYIHMGFHLLPMFLILTRLSNRSKLAFDW